MVIQVLFPSSRGRGLPRIWCILAWGTTAAPCNGAWPARFCAVTKPLRKWSTRCWRGQCDVTAEKPLTHWAAIVYSQVLHLCVRLSHKGHLLPASVFKIKKEKHYSVCVDSICHNHFSVRVPDTHTYTAWWSAATCWFSSTLRPWWPWPQPPPWEIT